MNALSRATNPILHFDDFMGVPLAGGRLYTYASGTETPVSTYRDSEGTLNLNPVRLNARGEAEVWLDPSVEYRFVLKNALGVTMYTVDHVTANTETFSAEGSDTILATETTEDGKTVVTFSVKEGSIGRTQLKNPRNLVEGDGIKLDYSVDEDCVVVSLSDSVMAFLEGLGYDGE